MYITSFSNPRYVLRLTVYSTSHGRTPPELLHDVVRGTQIIVDFLSARRIVPQCCESFRTSRNSAPFHRAQRGSYSGAFGIA